MRLSPLTLGVGIYGVGDVHYLVYGNGDRGCVEYTVPLIPMVLLIMMVRTLYGYILQVRAVHADPQTPRPLVQVAWSFGHERERYTLYPEIAASDVVANCNRHRLPLMQHVGQC